MAITAQDIHNAADQLVAAGENPTLAAIRKALGGGSYTTISEAMKEWKAKQQADLVEIREAAPQSISDKLESLGIEVWAVALEMANARLQSEREALEQARAEIEEEAAEAAGLADALNDEVEQLKTELEQKNNDLSAALENNQSVGNELKTALERITALEKELAITSTRLDDAQQERERLTKELEKARETTQEAQKMASDWKTQAHDENARSEQLNAEIEQLKAELANKSEIEEKAKQLDMQVHKLQISLDASVKATDELKAEIKQLRSANEEKTLELGKMTAVLEQNEQLKQKIDF
jgi:chromosome segregation ATPase